MRPISNSFGRHATEIGNLMRVFLRSSGKTCLLNLHTKNVPRASRAKLDSLRDMGVHTSFIKGTGLMVMEFFSRLFVVGYLGLRWTVSGLIVIALAIVAAPLTFQQIIQPSFAAQPPVLMVLGDSLVAGHGLPQGQAFPDVLGQMLQDDGIDVRMVNAGVSGDTTAGGLARLDWSLADNPDAAIIVLGGNDLLRGLDPLASYTNLDKIITRMKARNIAVLLAGMQAPRNFGADYAGEFNAIYRKLVIRHNVLFYPFFLDGVALKPTMNLADGMHPNQAGVTLIARKILPQVKALLAKTLQ